MTIEEMQKKKIELGFTNQILADNSGVPLGTVQKIMAGVTPAPRKKTLDALEKAFIEGEMSKKRLLGDMETTKGHDEISNPDMASGVKEDKVAYGSKRSGYTITEFLKVYKGRRVEMIDGTIYGLSAPHALHQMLAYEICNVFDQYLKREEKTSVAIMAPVHVVLKKDENTVLQPDVMVISDRKKLKKNGMVHGTPDLVVEILDSETRSKDRLLKNYKYGSSGVKEYWMVDLDKRQIEVIDYEKEMATEIYKFTDMIPVGIWDGKLIVDFAQIYSRIRFLMD